MLISDYIPKLIAINRTGKSLAVLNGFIDDSNPVIHKKLVLLSSNFSWITENKANGNLSKEEEKLQLTRLNNSLLDLVAELPTDWSIEVGQIEKQKIELLIFMSRYLWWIIFGTWTLILLALLLLGMANKKNIKTRITLEINSVAFSAAKGGDIQIEDQVMAMVTQQFDTTRIPAQYLFASENFGEKLDSIPIQPGQLIVTPIGDNKVPSIFFDRVELEQIGFQDTSRIRITIPEELSENENIIRIDLDNGYMYGRLNMQDSIIFELSNSAIENEGLSYDAKARSLVSAKVALPLGDAFQVDVEGSDPNFVLLIEPMPEANKKIITQNLSIGHLNFIRPEYSSPPQSAIIKGQLSFLNKKDRVYDTFELSKNHYMDLVGDTSMLLTSLSLSNKAIHLSFEGEVDLINTGATFPPDVLQNPSMLQWYFHNRFEWLAFILTLLIIFSVGLWGILKKITGG